MKVFEGNWDRFQSDFDKVIRKAKKLGIQPPIYTITGEELEKAENDGYVKMIIVEVEGNYLKVSGWEFLATITHLEAGNIFGKLSPRPIPERFRTTDKICEHCNQRRSRKDPYIVYNDSTGEYKQVGKSCLSDFTNERSAQGIASYLDGLTKIMDYEYSDWLGIGSLVHHHYDLISWIARINRTIIAEGGWVSQAKAQELGKAPTTYIAQYYLQRSKNMEPGEWRDHQPIQEDRDLARRVVEYFRSITPSGDYLYNLCTVLKGDYAPIKTRNLVASSIAAYNLAMGEQQEREAKKGYNQEPVGTPGDKVELKVRVEEIKEICTRFGFKVLASMITNSNQIVKWFTSNSPMEIGKEYTIKATLKDTKEYDGLLENYILRAKIL